MSSVDKAIHEKISSQSFFKENLVAIPEKAQQGMKHILSKAKERGMEVGEDQKKELMAKSMMESVNRLIF